MILKIVHYPLDSERETVSEQFQGSWRLGTAQALHAQYKCVSTVDIRHLGTPYGRVPRFLSTRELTDALCSLYSGDRYFLIFAGCVSGQMRRETVKSVKTRFVTLITPQRNILRVNIAHASVSEPDKVGNADI